MTVLARTRHGVSRKGRQRTAPARPAQMAAERTESRVEVVARRRRDTGAPQDRATYTCECGFQFQAAVSTSVPCPHCGDAQAW